MTARPLPVTVIAILLTVTGVVGIVFHLADFRTSGLFLSDLAWIELVRALAIVAGIFLLLGHNWARWLALGWIAFHAVIGALHSLFQFAFHAVLCVAFAWFLLRPAANRYFQSLRD